MRPVHRWDEMTAAQLRDVLEREPIAYVPIGTIEYHGPHLPLSTDTVHAFEFCLAAAARTGGVVLPPCHWSPNGNEDGPGSLMIREETYRALIRDILVRLAEQKVRWVVICTGHYPAKQEPILRSIADGIAARFPATRFIVAGPWCHPTDASADHAGKKEASLMMALRPRWTHMKRLRDPSAFPGVDVWAENRAKKYGPYWFDADAEEASARFGREYFKEEVEAFVKLFRKLTSEPH